MEEEKKSPIEKFSKHLMEYFYEKSKMGSNYERTCKEIVIMEASVFATMLSHSEMDDRSKKTIWKQYLEKKADICCELAKKPME